MNAVQIGPVTVNVLIRSAGLVRKGEVLGAPARKSTSSVGADPWSIGRVVLHC